MRRLRGMIIKELWAVLRDPKSRIVLVMPPLLQVRNLLRSIEPKVNGTQLTATATYKGPATETLVFLEYPYATAKPVDEDEKPAEPRPAGAVQPAK